MKGQAKPILAALILTTGCHLYKPDHSDPRGVPPPATGEITWESFFPEPWPDPLHEKYEEMYARTYPNPGRQHFETERPFSDVEKYNQAFEALAVPGTRVAAADMAVTLELPDSAAKTVSVKADEKGVRVTVWAPSNGHRYRVYRSQELVYPLPADADPASARMEREGDRVRILFTPRSTAARSGNSKRP